MSEIKVELSRRLRSVLVWAEVRTRFEKLHRWVDAPEDVAFLRSLHRHEFHVRLRISQERGVDREVEFIGVKRWLDRLVDLTVKLLPDTVSCEEMADYFVLQAASKYGEARTYECEVSEDGENGAVVWSAPHVAL